ncbi:hypothetical protein TYRP_001308 [Tyrophagus putrescentiae]|nr:hypothetical protein TYRP_001308 [Tyrophagus putrescentiae]
MALNINYDLPQRQTDRLRAPAPLAHLYCAVSELSPPLLPSATDRLFIVVRSAIVDHQTRKSFFLALVSFTLCTAAGGQDSLA